MENQIEAHFSVNDSLLLLDIGSRLFPVMKINISNMSII